jgi:hypothetical protein
MRNQLFPQGLGVCEILMSKDVFHAIGIAKNYFYKVYVE